MFKLNNQIWFGSQICVFSLLCFQLILKRVGSQRMHLKNVGACLVLLESNGIERMLPRLPCQVYVRVKSNTFLKEKTGCRKTLLVKKNKQLLLGMKLLDKYKPLLLHVDRLILESPILVWHEFWGHIFEMRQWWGSDEANKTSKKNIGLWFVDVFYAF